MPMITIGWPVRRLPWANPRRYDRFVDEADGMNVMYVLCRLRDLGFDWPDAARLSEGRR